MVHNWYERLSQNHHITDESPTHRHFLQNICSKSNAQKSFLWYDFTGNRLSITYKICMYGRFNKSLELNILYSIRRAVARPYKNELL